MDPLIPTLSHPHANLATSRLLLQLLQEGTTSCTQLSYAYGRVEHALALATREVHHLLQLLQEDDAPIRTPNERTPNACPTTCPRPSSPSSTSPSSSPSPPSPPPSSPTSAATDTAERRPN